MKKAPKYLYIKRTFATALALIGFCAAIFLFTRPLLAPVSESDVLKDSTNTNEQSENIFQSQNHNSDIGKGVNAQSYLIVSAKSGEIISSRNPNTTVAIASLTKLMTAYAVYKHGVLDDYWAITAQSTHSTRPVLGLQIGDRVKVSDLVNSMLIGSANDAAAALGQYLTHVSKRPAVEIMNEEVEKLGMSVTHFQNPIGFDSEQNYSSANDLLLLVNETNSIPLFKDIERKFAYSFVSEFNKTYNIKATNTLIQSDKDLFAIKTGFTDEAGGAMITAFTNNGERYILIVLNSSNREQDTLTLKKQVLSTLTK